MTLEHGGCNAWCTFFFKLADCLPETNVGVKGILHLHPVERDKVKLRYASAGLLMPKLGNNGLDAGGLVAV